MNHQPKYWKVQANGVGANGELYYNTVDPEDSKAASYGMNGLPKDNKQWTYEQLHMYSNETVGKHDGMKLDKNDNLYIGNNNAFWGNTDRCYIPEELAGKYIQVKAIAMNCRYPVIYDNLKTLTSHVIKVAEPVEEVAVKLDMPVPGKTPDTTPELPADAKYKVDQTPLWEVYEGGDWEDMASTDTFEEGKAYRVTVDVDLNVGEVFAEDCKFYINGQGVNRRTGEAGDGTYLFQFATLESLSFGCPTEHLQDVYLEIDNPVEGENPSYDVRVPFGAPYGLADPQDSSYAYRFGNVAWYLIEDGRYYDMYDTDTFEKGKEYEVRIALAASSTAIFDWEEQAAGYWTNPVINGEHGNMESPQLDSELEYALVTHRFIAEEAKEKQMLMQVSGVRTSDKITLELYPEGASAPVKTGEITGNGLVVFKNVIPGTYTLKATGEGYKNFTTTVVYKADDTTVNVNVAMLRQGDVTRAQFVTTLYRLAGSPRVINYDAVYDFPDVVEGQYYTDAVCWAYNNDITTGSNGKFNTSGKLSRQQLATFLFRFAEYMECDNTARGDYSSMLNANQVSEYAKESVSWAVGAGIISGSEITDSSGNKAYDLKPRGNTTRAQLAAILQRFCENNDL